MEKFMVIARKEISNPNAECYEDSIIREDIPFNVMADHHIQYSPYSDNLCGVSEAGKRKLDKMQEDGYRLYTEYTNVGLVKLDSWT